MANRFQPPLPREAPPPLPPPSPSRADIQNNQNRPVFAPQFQSTTSGYQSTENVQRPNENVDSKNGNDDSDDDGDGLYCKVCDFKCADHNVYNRHTRSLVHTQKVMASTQGQEAPAPMKQPLLASPQRPPLPRPFYGAKGMSPQQPPSQTLFSREQARHEMGPRLTLRSPLQSNRPAWRAGLDGNRQNFVSSTPNSSAIFEIHQLNPENEPGRPWVDPIKMTGEVNEAEWEDDDWQRCNVCAIDFTDETMYHRHCRGLMHAQRLISRDKDAGLIEADPVVKETPIDFDALRKKATDPNKRDILPSELGAPTMDKRWYCVHCNCSCSGQDAFEAHLKGKRHVKTLKMKASIGIPVDLPDESKDMRHSVQVNAIETGKRAELQSTIEKCPEPLVGLKYVVEYVSPVTPTRYVCNLCEAKCDGRTIISHLIGFKHRLRYLKEVRCEIYAELQLCADDKAEQTELLVKRCWEIEGQDGRPDIVQRLEVMENVSIASRKKQGSVNVRPIMLKKSIEQDDAEIRQLLKRDVDMRDRFGGPESSTDRGHRSKKSEGGGHKSPSSSKSSDGRLKSPKRNRKRHSSGSSNSDNGRKSRNQAKTGEKSNSIMKTLLQTLVAASTKKDNPDAARLSAALTAALLKAKEMREMSARSTPFTPDSNTMSIVGQSSLNMAPPPAYGAISMGGGPQFNYNHPEQSPSFYNSRGGMNAMPAQEPTYNYYRPQRHPTPGNNYDKNSGPDPSFGQFLNSQPQRPMLGHNYSGRPDHSIGQSMNPPRPELMPMFPGFQQQQVPPAKPKLGSSYYR